MASKQHIDQTGPLESLMLRDSTSTSKSSISSCWAGFPLRYLGQGGHFGAVSLPSREEPLEAKLWTVRLVAVTRASQGIWAGEIENLMLTFDYCQHSQLCTLAGGGVGGDNGREKVSHYVPQLSPSR